MGLLYAQPKSTRQAGTPRHRLGEWVLKKHMGTPAWEDLEGAWTPEERKKKKKEGMLAEVFRALTGG